MRGLAAFGVVLVVSLPCDGRDWNTITLDCKLSPASVLTFDKGQLTPEQLTPGKPDDMMLVTFTGFDEKSGRATMVGNSGSTPVLFFDVMGHMQIIEITESMNVATTTINITGQGINAVHTRHMAMADGGVLSIYAGPCRMR
jgi:hypothetical protein